MPVDSCLSEQQLRDFQLGDMPEADLAGVAAHLDACPRCESLAQRLDGQADSMLSAIRGTVRKSTDETRVIRRYSPPAERLEATMLMPLQPAAGQPPRRRLWWTLAALTVGAAIALILKFLADAFLATSVATEYAPVADVNPVENSALAVEADSPALPPAGIAWFATWESGLREAQRTGKPILLVAAAPSCAGVSGVW